MVEAYFNVSRSRINRSIGRSPACLHVRGHTSDVREKRGSLAAGRDNGAAAGAVRRVGRPLGFLTGRGDTLAVSSTVVTSSPDVMGGTPVFAGTRVPIEALLDYLEGGESIEDFLEGFPSVTREQVISFLEETKARVLAEAR